MIPIGTKKQAKEINSTMYEISWMHPLGIIKHKLEYLDTLKRLVQLSKSGLLKISQAPRKPYNHDKKRSV